MSSANLRKSLQCRSSALPGKGLDYLKMLEARKLSSESEIQIVRGILYEVIVKSYKSGEDEVAIIKHCTEFLVARWKQANCAPSFNLDHLLYEGLKKMAGKAGTLRDVNELTRLFLQLSALPDGCRVEISRPFFSRILNFETETEHCSCSPERDCELLIGIRLRITGIKTSFFAGIWDFSQSVRQLSNSVQGHLESLSSGGNFNNHLSAVEEEVCDNFIPAVCSGCPASGDDLTQAKNMSRIVSNTLQLGLRSSALDVKVEETIAELFSGVTEFLQAEETRCADGDSEIFDRSKACAVTLGLLLSSIANRVKDFQTSMSTVIRVTAALLSRSSAHVDLFVICQVFVFLHSVVQFKGKDTADEVLNILNELLTENQTLFVHNDKKKQKTVIKIIQYGLTICSVLFNSNLISSELVVLLKSLSEKLSNEQLCYNEKSQSMIANGILLARCHRKRGEHLAAMEAVESCIAKLSSFGDVGPLIAQWTKAKASASKKEAVKLRNRTSVTNLKNVIPEERIAELLLAEIESYKDLSNSDWSLAAAAINEALSCSTLPDEHKLPLLCTKIMVQYGDEKTLITESDLLDVFREAYALCADRSATWETLVRIKLIHFFQDWRNTTPVSLQNLHDLVDCYAEAAKCSYATRNVKETTDICHMAFVSLRLFGDPVRALSLLLAMNRLVEKHKLQNNINSQVVSKSLGLLSCLISDSFSTLQQPALAEKYAKKAGSECEKLGGLSEDNETPYLTFLSRLALSNALRQSSESSEECNDLLRECFNDAFVEPEKTRTSYHAVLASVKLHRMAGKTPNETEPSVCSLLVACKRILGMMAKLNPLIYNDKSENSNKSGLPFNILPGDSDISAVMQLSAIQEVLCCLYDTCNAYLRLGNVRKTLSYQRIGLEISNFLWLQKWELKFHAIKSHLYSICLKEDKAEQFSTYIRYRISSLEREESRFECDEPADNDSEEDVLKDINRRLIAPYSQMGSSDSDAIPVYSRPMDIDSYVSKSSSLSASPLTTRHANFKEKAYPLPQLFEHEPNCKCLACTDFSLVSLQFDLALVLVQYCLLTGRLKEGSKICHKLSGRVESFADIKIGYHEGEELSIPKIPNSHIVACNLFHAETYYYQENKDLSMQLVTKVERQLELFNMDKFYRTHLEAKVDLLKALLIQPFPSALMSNGNVPLDQLNTIVDSLSACHLSDDKSCLKTPVSTRPRTKAQTKKPSARRQLLNVDDAKTASKTPRGARKKSTLEATEKFKIFSDTDPAKKSKKKDVRKKTNTLPVPELPNVESTKASSEYDFVSSDTDYSPGKASSNIMQARKAATRRHRKKFAPIYTADDPEKLRVVVKKSSASGKNLYRDRCARANGGSSAVVNSEMKIKLLSSALIKANVVGDFWLVKQSSQALSNAHYHLYMEGNKDPTSSVKATACHLFSFGVSMRTVIYLNVSNKFSRLEKGLAEADKYSKQYIQWLSETVSDYNPIHSLSRCVEYANSYINDLADYMPAGWAACAISLARTSNGSATMISRLENGCAPVHVEISGKKMQGLLKSFDNIMDRNITTMKSRDKSSWWTQRRNIDTEMKTLFESLAQNTLGHFRGMLLGNVLDEDEHRRILSDVRALAERFQLNDVKQQELYVFFNSWHCLNAEEKLLASAHLCGTVDSNEAVKMSSEIERMSAKYEMDKLSRQHVTLILDKDVERLPWEGLPLLQNQSTTRLPSADVLKMQLKLLKHSSNAIASEGVDLNDVSYVINPKGDLVKTQNRLVDWFYSLPSWKGIVSRPPSSVEWAKSMTDFDLFIYCGHGSGEDYMSPEGFSKIETRAVSLLMGCSSGKLEQGGILEPDGIVVSYLISGAPCVLACLWPVTDKDIDKFLAAVLAKWSSNEDGGETLPVSARRAESVCKIKTNALACVVYGLPIHCQISIAKFIESMPEALVKLLEK